jgi:hypothetical protein
MWTVDLSDTVTAVADPNEVTPVFDFMVLRPPVQPEPAVLRREYIHDDLAEPGEPMKPEQNLPPGTLSGSSIGLLVASQVFADPDDLTIPEKLQSLLNSLLPFLVAVTPVWNGTGTDGNGRPYAPVAELERLPHLVHNGTYYVIPARPEMLGDNLFVSRMREVTEIIRSADASTHVEAVWRRILTCFDQQMLHTIVFSDGVHSADFLQARRSLFDALYLAYLLRRWTAVDLNPLMSALRCLHVIEAMAVDELIGEAFANQLDDSGRAVLMMVQERFPTLKGWDLRTPRPGLPLLNEAAALQRYWRAMPVIHPIFARLFWYTRAFNDLKPIGVGDLKVVKQKLLGYEPGEISDIHNVMLGESKVRAHRRLEKTEERFSLSSSSEQETSSDTQSADRFEVKREAEQVIKNDLAINAGTSVTYNQMPVVASVNASLAVNRSETSTDKSAHNFSREVISKAVSRVASRTATERSTTKTFETEERNEHTFDNVGGQGHVSGIYRWVDKRYEAQVFNYGKRMMFEFVLPEPAAFLVEQRLRAFEATVALPDRPNKPVYDAVDLGFEPAGINETVLSRLNRQYGLSEQFPAAQRVLNLINPQTGEAFFADKDLHADDTWIVRSYDCQVQAEGYQLAGFQMSGYLYFRDQTPGADVPNMRWRDRNLFNIVVNGETVAKWDLSTTDYAAFGVPDTDVPGGASDNGGPVTLRAQPILGPDRVQLQLDFQEVTRFGLRLSMVVTLPPASLLRWQESVYEKVYAIEQKRVEAANLELRLAHESAMTTYRNRLAEVQATAINELLQGTSEADNRALILTELKRACLAMLTRDYDSFELDDLLTNWETMGKLPVKVKQTRLEVTDSADGPAAAFKATEVDGEFPALIHDASIGKGRFIQFLEQAFEWAQLGWMAYPYFWATTPKWVELMSRRDDTDPSLTAFLRAGAIKVLLAVSPNYDESVTHFLATREPWRGGDTPVLGDPLYLPLYEEMRRAQDDRYGGVAEGEPWQFTVPTALVYLHGSRDELPTLAAATPPANP